MAKTGRPKKEINKADFEALLGIQCTLEEIQSFLDMKLGGCSVDTIERWCKRTYGKTFAEVSEQKRALGRISLRRSQFRLAEKNVSMNIWLSKQYLGQRDNPDQEERDARVAVMKAKAAALTAGQDEEDSVVIVDDMVDDYEDGEPE